MSVGGKSTLLPRSSYAEPYTQPAGAFGCIHRSPRAAPQTSSYRAAVLLCSWTAASGIAVRNTAARHPGPAPTPIYGKRRCAVTQSEMCGPLGLRKPRASLSFGSGSARSQGIRTDSRGRYSAGLSALRSRRRAPSTGLPYTRTLRTSASTTRNRGNNDTISP